MNTINRNLRLILSTLKINFHTLLRTKYKSSRLKLEISIRVANLQAVFWKKIQRMFLTPKRNTRSQKLRRLMRKMSLTTMSQVAALMNNLTMKKKIPLNRRNKRTMMSPSPVKMRNKAQILDKKENRIQVSQ